MKNLISLVIPVYNEAAIIRANLEKILAAVTQAKYTIECIVVDDGSSDQTLHEVDAAIAKDARIRSVSFTRNFGKEAAILAGLSDAKGDAVIVLDADLQHPPELIPQMLALWEKGIPIVEAVKENRGKESHMSRLFAAAFYRIFRGLSKLDLENHSDFKLLDRAVVDTYLAMPEQHRFFRGLIVWTGYVRASIPFSVPPRSDNSVSHWSRLKLLRYGFNNLISFSSAPLKWVTGLGFGTLFLGIIMGIISLVQKLSGTAIDGFTTVNLLLVIIGGSILFSLGVIGHYLARVYDVLKGRPIYLIKSKTNDK